MMRRLRVWSLVATLVLLAAACDWPMVGHNAGHTGYTIDLSINRDKLPPTSNPTWTSDIGPTVGVVVANGVVYASANSVYAMDARSGATLWTATGSGDINEPAVVDGVLYVAGSNGLLAFDPNGSRNCTSGTPKTCSPLWTGPTTAAPPAPVVADHVVYVGGDKLYAFDATGNQGCSGAPKMCAPLWTGTTGGFVNASPAVANGIVYVAGADGQLSAFDANGSTGCSGTPKTCSPLWTATTGNPSGSSPAVTNGVVYVGSTDQKLYAFDANGSTNCSGGPKRCAPLWTATTSSAVSSPAIAGGVVYVDSGSPDNKLYAFDANGSTNCSGAPKSCAPLWTAATGGGTTPQPAIAYGVVYIGAANGTVDGFDSYGQINCSGTPKSCTPLWRGLSSSLLGDAAVSNGFVYLGTIHGVVAFRLG